jgi:predicted ATPase
MQIQQKENFFVLAGTSGTGKSTIISQLRERGFLCFDEAARAVLEEQLPINGPALPSNNPMLFIQTMKAKNIKNFNEASIKQTPVFFDRGLPDLIHYANRFDVSPTEFELASKQYRYNENVFVLNPWREIFVNDHVRKMTFEKSVEFHELILNIYKAQHYNLIEVQFGSVTERTNFIIETMNANR